MHKNLFRTFSLISIVFGAQLAASPDLIVINADVRTSDKSNDRSTAFAVKYSKFLAVGNTDEILSMLGESTRVIDANGKTVVPGFIDSHTHLSSGAKIVTGINLTEIREKAVWLEMIKERVKSMEPGEWLLGGRWDYTFENKGYPTRWELDAVAPNNPVALSDIDGHSMWINTLAMDLSCLLYTSPSPRDKRQSRMPSSA